MSQSSSMPALQMRVSESQEHPGRKIISIIWHRSDCSHSPQWALRTQVWKRRTLAPDSGGAHERNDFSEPRLLHLPIHRKVLNSLTWGIWSSLTHKNTSDVQTTCPLLQNFCITLTSPLASSEQSSQGCLSHLFSGDAISQPWSPKNSHWIKHSTQLLGCMYFFQSTVPASFTKRNDTLSKTGEQMLREPQGEGKWIIKTILSCSKCI